MTYTKLPFEQYFIDQSLGSRGGKPQIKVNYKEVKYKHGKHEHNAFYCVLFDEKRDLYQIYFKETSSKSQWLSNFNFPQKYYDSFQYAGKDIQLKAASGWSELYCALKWYIRNELSDLIKLHGKKEVEIIGWSLGSAIAQLCAQDLFFNYGIQSYVYTFGSVKPWYGKDKDMKEYLAKCTKAVYNFYDWNDIVGYMVPLCGYFAMNHVKVKQDKFSIFRLFKPGKYHCEYWKADYYKEIK